MPQETELRYSGLPVVGEIRSYHGLITETEAGFNSIKLSLYLNAMGKCVRLKSLLFQIFVHCSCFFPRFETCLTIKSP